MEIKGNVTISRLNGTDDTEQYVITVDDDASGATFLQIKMNAENFAKAITGLAHQSATMEARKLDVVGKKRIREKRTIVCPLDTYSRDELVQWLIDNAQEECWTLDTYLGSQSSIVRMAGVKYLNYSVYRYE